MTAEVEAVARRWGSSIGFVIPGDVVKNESIKPDQRIRVRISTIPLAKDLLALVGELKRKENTQRVKDELRKGWSKHA